MKVCGKQNSVDGIEEGWSTKIKEANLAKIQQQKIDMPALTVFQQSNAGMESIGACCLNNVKKLGINTEIHRKATTLQEIQQQRLLSVVSIIMQVNQLTPHILTSIGFCLNEWMPEMLMYIAQNIDVVVGAVSRPIIAANQTLPANVQLFSECVIVAPIIEEILFRGVVQEIFMKKVSAALLQRSSPHAANWLQSNTYAKIMRVALSTLLFVLAHTSTENCAMSNRPIGVISVGILLGAVVENLGLKQGLRATIGLHAINNFIAFLFNKSVIAIDPIFAK